MTKLPPCLDSTPEHFVSFGISDNDPDGTKGGTEYWITLKMRVTNIEKVRKVIDYIERTLKFT